MARGLRYAAATNRLVPAFVRVPVRARAIPVTGFSAQRRHPALSRPIVTYDPRLVGHKAQPDGSRENNPALSGPQKRRQPRKRHQKTGRQTILPVEKRRVAYPFLRSVSFEKAKVTLRRIRLLTASSRPSHVKSATGD